MSFFSGWFIRTFLSKFTNTNDQIGIVCMSSLITSLIVVFETLLFIAWFLTLNAVTSRIHAQINSKKIRFSLLNSLCNQLNCTGVLVITLIHMSTNPTFLRMLSPMPDLERRSTHHTIREHFLFSVTVPWIVVPMMTHFSRIHCPFCTTMQFHSCF